MATDALPRLTLYSRTGCHLCEVMAAELQAFKRAHRFEFDVVDVDANVQAVRRYGERVPVLAYGAREVCQTRLDSAAFTAFMAEFR